MPLPKNDGGQAAISSDQWSAGSDILLLEEEKAAVERLEGFVL
jgi:hypothetical protein